MCGEDEFFSRLFGGELRRCRFKGSLNIYVCTVCAGSLSHSGQKSELGISCGGRPVLWAESILSLPDGKHPDSFSRAPAIYASCMRSLRSRLLRGPSQASRVQRRACDCSWIMHRARYADANFPTAEPSAPPNWAAVSKRSALFLSAGDILLGCNTREQRNFCPGSMYDVLIIY